MQILSYPEKFTAPELLSQIQGMEQQAWPNQVDGCPAVPVHDPQLRPVLVMLVDDGTVLASLAILSKEIVHAGQEYIVGGLRSVVTRAEMRGKGYGRRLVATARMMMIDRNFDIGLFTCDVPLQKFYESAGWTTLPGTVLIGGVLDDPFPSDQPGFEKVTMADFFSTAGQLGRASFYNARIGLYPGQIDKLW